ncbi:Ubiquitin-like modifier-activating enzyme ATG7 [Armadillidium vulgare]|nr:Ubiquitin-like modifier-activating enzyme ATG7 [Armadillidium vulgare]
MLANYWFYNTLQNTPQSGEVLTKGILISTNTLEDFKKEDKSELIKEVASKIWNGIKSGEAETQTSLLSYFLIFVFGDLKKYHYYWWCAFPTFLYPRSVTLCSSIDTLQTKIKDSDLIDKIQRSLRETDVCLAFFTLIIEESNVQILPLSSYYSTLKERKTNCKVWLGFSDPSNSPQHPGWVLRNLLTLAAVRW